MSLKQLPTIVLYHKEHETQYKQICDALKQTFLDVSIVANEVPQDTNTPFYWIVFTQNELLNCLHHNPKGVPIGYKLFLRYLESTAKQPNDDKSQQTVSYLMNLTQNIFKNLTLCTSGIHSDAKNDIKTVCNVLSGTFDGNFTDSITHLIESTIGSQKHAAAVSSNRCHIVTARWIYDSYINGKIMAESKYCPPLFVGYFISVTGLKSTEREQIKIFVTQYGGCYCKGLSQECTHLIAKELVNNDKCKAALKWNIPIIDKQWFYDHLKFKGCVNINKYVLKQANTTNNNNNNNNVVQYEEKNVEKDLDINDDLDIGEDTELREVIQMIQDHDESHETKEKTQTQNYAPKLTNTQAYEQEEEDLCYLQDCVVLLLCLEPELKKEAAEILRRGKGTKLCAYHWMGTHVVTSSLDDIKSKYPQVFDHCIVVHMDFLRHCDHAQNIVDCNKYNLLIHQKYNKMNKNYAKVDSQSSITTKTDVLTAHDNNDESAQYEEYFAACLNMNVSNLMNHNLFEDISFNIDKLSLNKQQKVGKLIAAANGRIVRSGKEASYLVCGVISTVEFESNHFEEIECVSVIWIAECLRAGKLLNVSESVSFLPELLSTAQSNTLFVDVHICLSQFDNKYFERYRLQNLLSGTNATYHRSFHPKLCDILICKHCKGAKYESAKEKNIAIVHWLWLVDSIRNCKQMKVGHYKLSTNGTKAQKPKRKKIEKENNNNTNNIQHRKQSSVLGDIFGANIQNALTNFGGDDDNLCSPALASKVPPNKDIEVFDIEGITQKEPSIEGIEGMSPIPVRVKKQNDAAASKIVLFCHRSLDQNKKNLMQHLVTNYGLKQAKSLSKQVTHYVIDTDLSNKTKEMRTVKERQKKGILQVVSSKWLQLKRKEFEKNANVVKQNVNQYKNSITRARKRKYQELEFTASNYLGEEYVDEDITQFEDDKDILSAINKKQKRRKRHKTNNNGDIRKHIKMTHKIGVLLTGFSDDKKAKYEKIIEQLNGIALNDENYAQIDDDNDESVNFKYIVAAKLVRSEKIIIGIIRKKIIVKSSFLDGCKKAKKWLSAEPHCWMNDDELIRFLPSNGEETKIKNESLKSKIDLVQAIRAWRNIEIENVAYYNKNIFIWLPESRISTYLRILKAIKANVFVIRMEKEAGEIEKQCKEIADRVKIDEVFLANQDEIKQTAKSICGKDNNYKAIYKSMMKGLTEIATFWFVKQNIECYDSDYILDWALERCVFTNSDVTKDEYKYSI